MYIFHFSRCQDKDKVLYLTPWNFKGHLLVLQHWSPEMSLEEIDLSFATFWIQLHGLPLAGMNKYNIGLIGASVDHLLDMDPLPEGITCKRFFRIKVSFNITNPLKACFSLPRPNLPNAYIRFRYEKLSDFCYYCGRLGHTMYWCLESEALGSVKRYGSWLRANSWDSSISTPSLGSSFISAPPPATPPSTGISSTSPQLFGLIAWSSDSPKAQHQSQLTTFNPGLPFGDLHSSHDLSIPLYRGILGLNHPASVPDIRQHSCSHLPVSEDLENIFLADSSSFLALLADPSLLQNSLANKKIISPSLPTPTSVCSPALSLFPCVEFAPPTPSCLLHDKMNFSSDPSTFQAMMSAWRHLSNIPVSISPINLMDVCPLFHATFPSTMASNAHSLASSPSLVLDSTSSHDLPHFLHH